MDNTDILYIINPKSNEGNSVRLWKKAKKLYNFLFWLLQISFWLTDDVILGATIRILQKKMLFYLKISYLSS